MITDCELRGQSVTVGGQPKTVIDSVVYTVSSTTVVPPRGVVELKAASEVIVTLVEFQIPVLLEMGIDADAEAGYALVHFVLVFLVHVE